MGIGDPRPANSAIELGLVSPQALSAEAEELVTHRSGIRVPITSADDFFSSIADKVEVLGELADQAPSSTTIAVAQLKRYIPIQEERIRLRDLVVSETRAALNAVDLAALPIADQPPPTVESIEERAGAYEKGSYRLITFLATAAYFGDGTAQDELWMSAIQAMANRNRESGGYTDLVLLQKYPTVLLEFGLVLGA
ncbi:MAG: hypothetical protein ACLQPH_05075, partial [Acidimicrobiales bacterium]